MSGRVRVRHPLVWTPAPPKKNVETMIDQAEVIGLTVARPARVSRLGPLANRNFRLLWLGENVSLLGDQFYFVALPWLVFQITGSALAFGTILMVGGIPRAIFTLIGGAVADRFSARAVMIVSNLLRLAIIALLTLIAASKATQLWMLYAITLGFGVVDAFFHPAYRAMIPIIVEKEDLKASNSLMLGTSQLAFVAGPGLAGVLVHNAGVVASFTFDAFTFLFTAIMLLLMRPAALLQNRAKSEAAPKRTGLLTEIGEMLALVRHDKRLLTLVGVIAAINLLFVGPFVVGSATLSQVRFEEGSAAFGAMLSTFAIGVLIGTLAAGVVHPQRPGLVSLLMIASQGVLMAIIGCTSVLVLACSLWILIGCSAGFGNVNAITLTQKHVPPQMMGRVMSLIVLAEVGLTPISNALAGVLGELNVTALFVGAGGLLSMVALLAALNPEMHAIET
jgi:MFS family permease